MIMLAPATGFPFSSIIFALRYSPEDGTRLVFTASISVFLYVPGMSESFTSNLTYGLIVYNE